MGTNYNLLCSPKEAAEHAKAAGIPVSEYALRGLIRSGAIPACRAGRKILVYWPHIENYLMCADGIGNAAAKLP